MSSQPQTFWQRIGSALPSFGFGYASALSGNNAFSHNNAQAGLINAGSLINARGFGIDQQVEVHDLLGVAEIAREHRPEVQQTFRQAQGLISTVDDEIAHGMRVVDRCSAEALAIADRRSGEALAIADRRSAELIGESKAYRKILTELTSMDFTPTAKVTSIMGALYLELQYKLIGKITETVTELVSENPVASFTLMALGAGAWLCHKYRQALAPVSGSDLAEPMLNADTIYQHLSESQKVELLNLVLPLTRYIEQLQAHDVSINFELIKALASVSAETRDEIFAEMIAGERFTYWRLLARLRFNEVFNGFKSSYQCKQFKQALFDAADSEVLCQQLVCHQATDKRGEALKRFFEFFRIRPHKFGEDPMPYFKVLLSVARPLKAAKAAEVYYKSQYGFSLSAANHLKLMQVAQPYETATWYDGKTYLIGDIEGDRLVEFLALPATEREQVLDNYQRVRGELEPMEAMERAFSQHITQADDSEPTGYTYNP